MAWIFPITMLLVCELVADIFSKEYSVKGHWYLWVGALFGYIIANIFWLWAIRSGSELARGAIIFSVGSAVIATTLGIYFYHESVTKIQIAGMVLGLLSLILIFWD